MIFLPFSSRNGSICTSRSESMEPHRKWTYVSGQLAALSVAGVEIDRWNKLSGAVASGSFVGRLTTGRVNCATRKMTSSRGERGT